MIDWCSLRTYLMLEWSLEWYALYNNAVIPTPIPTKYGESYMFSCLPTTSFDPTWTMAAMELQSQRKHSLRLMTRRSVCTQYWLYRLPLGDSYNNIDNYFLIWFWNSGNMSVWIRLLYIEKGFEITFSISILLRMKMLNAAIHSFLLRSIDADVPPP